MHLGRYHVRSGRIDAGMAQIIETILQFIQILSDLVEALGSGSADGHWLPLVSSVAGLLLFVLRLLEIQDEDFISRIKPENKKTPADNRPEPSELCPRRDSNPGHAD